MINNKLLKKDLKEKRELVNITLDRFLPRKDEYPKDIHKAMRHTLFAGGKRLRPYLMLRTFELFSDEVSKVQPLAAAIEMLHTFTLIHDDLPAIDDDDYRRGKKTCHVVYGDDLALLAGDSLLCYAFDLLTTIEMSDENKIKMIRELASESGDQGLILGQMKDILSEGKDITKEELDFIHRNKTGRLIKLAIRFGCYAAEASKEDTKNMEIFGEKIGLAFQIVDDILDIEGSSKKMGKTVGKDIKVSKATYPAVYGLDKSKEMATKLVNEAKKLLEKYGDKAEMLSLLTDFILLREF